MSKIHRRSSKVTSQIVTLGYSLEAPTAGNGIPEMSQPTLPQIGAQIESLGHQLFSAVRQMPNDLSTGLESHVLERLEANDVATCNLVPLGGHYDQLDFLRFVAQAEFEAGDIDLSIVRSSPPLKLSPTLYLCNDDACHHAR